MLLTFDITLLFIFLLLLCILALAIFRFFVKPKQWMVIHKLPQSESSWSLTSTCCSYQVSHPHVRERSVNNLNCCSITQGHFLFGI